MMEQIRLEGVEKIYRGKGEPVQALSGVNLTIQKGEMVAVMGTSGSGKTTLLNILGLIDRPTAGSYFLEGNDVSVLPDSKLARLRNETLGFVLQDFGLIRQYTAQQNVILPLRYSRFPKKEWKSRTEAALESVGLAGKGKSFPTELSGGQKQRVAIARAMVAEGSVLLADEPTGALDSKTSEEIMELFLGVKERGKTVILVTHDPHIAGYCDRVVSIEDGALREEHKGASRLASVIRDC